MTWLLNPNIYIYIYHQHHDAPASMFFFLTLTCHSSYMASLRSVFPATFCITTEFLSICSRWSSNICSSVCRGLNEHIVYEFVLTSLACDVRPIWMVFEIDGWWPYSCCFVGCCIQDLFNPTCTIPVQLLSSFLSMRLIISMYCIHVVVLTWAPLEKHCVLFIR